MKVNLMGLQSRRIRRASIRSGSRMESSSSENERVDMKVGMSVKNGGADSGPHNEAVARTGT